MEPTEALAHAGGMKPVSPLGSALLLAPLLIGCMSLPEPDPPPASARQLTELRCGGCHAVSMEDASPNPNAPPLRDMFKRYPIYALADALRKGIEVGHHGMPRFALAPEESAAIISYLDSLNPCARPSSDDAAMERCFAPM